MNCKSGDLPGKQKTTTSEGSARSVHCRVQRQAHDTPHVSLFLSGEDLEAWTEGVEVPSRLWDISTIILDRVRGKPPQLWAWPCGPFVPENGSSLDSL